MKKKLLALSVTLAFSSAPAALYAEGNFNAGKTKAASCAGCHGDLGNSMMPLFPKLAGQHPTYIVKQLTAFKDGSRKEGTMSAIALSLSEQDMLDIAAFYEAQSISKNSLPVLDDDDDEDDEDEDAKEPVDINTLIAKGKDIYRNGDLDNEVSACIACHGPKGEGNQPASFPTLKWQHADYLIKTLKDYKSGARSKNPDNMMNMIAKKMTDEEIEAVSYHISVMK